MFWKSVAGLLRMLRFFSWLFCCFVAIASVVVDVVVVQAVINCEAGPTSTHHIQFGKGQCFIWSLPDTEYDCCKFCNGKVSGASQWIPPYGHNPFDKTHSNAASCCCYEQGEFADGGDGTKYYFE